ncbi:MAG: PHP domain-containing protein [Verrucomicrobiota bacterium]|nr:PHP domain-containing protein [Verrucomicrobiota bacterium]
MNEFRADLHTHTYCSDGSDAPEALLRKAKAAGLQGLSITDHDTIDAYSPALFSLASELGIRLLPGVELSSEFNDTSVHILGYGIDIEDASLREFLRTMILRRTERNRNILEKLKKRGLVIDEKELEEVARKAFSNRTIGRPHIAEMMVRKGYVRTHQEAFEKYLQEGALCYAPGIKYTPSEVVDEIHRAGGKAVLAHPHFIQRGALLKHLLSLPFQGIECHYGNFHREQEKPWLAIAKEKGWIATGGSDYHGEGRIHISLGCSWVSEATFNALLSKTE